jgi:peptide deformylase
MQVINCLKENNPVINKKLKEVSVDEGLDIAKDLFNVLNKRQDGIGLAANQVGIDASVAVVNVREPIILINPKIIKAWDEIPYYEGCLSYPKKGVQTERYKNIIIKTEQEESDWYFSGAPNPSDGRGSWEDSQRKKEDAELRLLETVCVQHEIDHLNGIVCMDRQMVTTIVNEKKVNRNEPCPCGSGKKYKKCCMS